MNEYQVKTDAPYSVAVLVLGILSIVFCICYGIIGLALGIVAIVLSNSSMKAINAMPEVYSEGSIKNMKAGRICAIIGVSLSALFIIFIIIAVIADSGVSRDIDYMFRHL